MVTKEKIEKFIRIRNRSEFDSNLQFQFDLESVGLRIADLGEVTTVGPGHYMWEFPFGIMRECDGKMTLEPK